MPDSPTPLILGPLILGVGNRYRRDDGAGAAAAEMLAVRGLDAHAVDGDGATLAALWEGRGTVILIDAMRSGLPAGRIRRIDAHAGELPADCGFFNSHAFGPAQAVETARALGKLPARLIIFGVEGGDFGWGEALSAPVAAALPELCAAVVNEALKG
jgi:hydrogenase maturation protease